MCMEKKDIEVESIEELVKLIDECPDGTILEIDLDDEDGDEDGG